MSAFAPLLRGITRPASLFSASRATAITHKSLASTARMSSTTAPPFLPHNYEVIVARPSLTPSREATVQKFKAGFAIQRQHPDFIGVPIEGTIVAEEDEKWQGRTLRVLEWTSYEGHMSNFRGGPTYKAFVSVREGAYEGEVNMKHYSFTSPLPKAPVMEYMRLQLSSPTHFATFHSDFSAALNDYVVPSPGCTGITVGQETEDPSVALCFMGWEKLEDHTKRFPASERFPPFREAMDRIVSEYLRGGTREAIEIWHVDSCEPGEGVPRE